MKIIRLFYKKCKFEEGCGIGRVIKGICDVCGEAYYEATPPALPRHIKILRFFLPHFIEYWYVKIKWKIKLRGNK